MELAYLAALGCALCYGVGSILEDVGAKRTSGVVSAMSQPVYLLGLGLDAFGWLLSLLALQRLPLFAVQAAVASSVAVTVLLAAWLLHNEISRRQVIALVALGAGLVLLAVSAAPDSPAPISGWAEVLLVLGVGAVAVAGLVAKALQGERAAGTLGAISGLAFGGTAICARALEADQSILDVLRDPLLLGLAGYGAVGLVLFASALTSGSVTVATASQFSAETVVPAIVGLVLLGDHARAGLAGAAAAGFVLTVAAAVGLTLVSPRDRVPVG